MATQAELIMDYVRDYLNGIITLEEVLKNLLFWKEKTIKMGAGEVEKFLSEVLD